MKYTVLLINKHTTNNFLNRRLIFFSAKNIRILLFLMKLHVIKTDIITKLYRIETLTKNMYVAV